MKEPSIRCEGIKKMLDRRKKKKMETDLKNTTENYGVVLTT